MPPGPIMAKPEYVAKLASTPNCLGKKVDYMITILVTTYYLQRR
jgi:hypothetical protein